MEFITKVCDNSTNRTGAVDFIPPENRSDEGPATLPELIGLGLLFFSIGLVGIVGNSMVILAVFSERKMRTSVTNLLITNLAFADLLIMVLGIPEIVQFLLNRGWLLPDLLCRLNRYVLVISLYASVLILVAVSIERYIAIIEPIKTHIFCSRRRLWLVLCVVWPTALLAGLPTLLFNSVTAAGDGSRVNFCMIHFPGDHHVNFLIFKYTEFILFYLLPMCIQASLYMVITRRLFLGSEKLHRRLTVRDQAGCEQQRAPDAIRARQGVVKMLIASVFIYFISYSPQHAMLFYNTFSPQQFHKTWSFLVAVMIIAYINSAVNPILYVIFSQNFRRRFKKILLPCPVGGRAERRAHSAMSPSSSRVWRLTSVRTAHSEF